MLSELMSVARSIAAQGLHWDSPQQNAFYLLVVCNPVSLFKREITKTVCCAGKSCFLLLIAIWLTMIITAGKIWAIKDTLS